MERIIRLLIFVLFCTRLWAEDEFIFWAELSSKDLILTHQSQNLSPAMTKSSENSIRIYSCELKYNNEDEKYLQKTALGIVDNEMPQKLKFRFLKAHEKELTECFSIANVQVRDKTISKNLKAENTIYIKMLPLRFVIDFGRESALIYQLIKP